MAGERLLQVRLDEGRTAEGQYQSNEAMLFRAQRRITYHTLPSPETCGTASGRTPAAFHTRVVEAFKRSRTRCQIMPDKVPDTAVEQCDRVG